MELIDHIPSNEIVDYEQELIDTLPSLYRESENYKNLLLSILEPIKNQQLRLLWFKNNMFNIDLAENAHLDWIGMIVGQSRLLVSFNQERYYGYEGSYQSETLGTVYTPSAGGYWNSYSNFVASTARRLNDDEYRRIIKARIINNNSDCTRNDLISVINLLTNRNDSILSLIKHGKIGIKATDTDRFLAYFIDQINLNDNIIPISYGVSIQLQE